jgi:hypothetical protein
MKKRHTVRIIIIGSFIILLFLIAAAIPLWPSLPATIKLRFAPQPPDMLFRSVFGQPVPISIRNLETAGSDTDQVIWMKFHIGETSISSFAGAVAPIPADEFHVLAPRSYFHVSRNALEPSDRKAVDMRWTDVYRSKKPRYFSFYSPNAMPWFGIIVVDHATGMAYIRATKLNHGE